MNMTDLGKHKGLSQLVDPLHHVVILDKPIKQNNRLSHALFILDFTAGEHFFPYTYMYMQ